jgi:hypothetical protein
MSSEQGEVLAWQHLSSMQPWHDNGLRLIATLGHECKLLHCVADVGCVLTWQQVNWVTASNSVSIKMPVVLWPHPFLPLPDMAVFVAGLQSA